MTNEEQRGQNSEFELSNQFAMQDSGNLTKRHPQTNAVQSRIERKVLASCLEQGLIPYGMIVDAVSHIFRKHSPKGSYFRTPLAREKFPGMSADEVAQYIEQFSAPLEDTLLEAVSENRLDNEDVIIILRDILDRYTSFCEAVAKKNPGKHPYNINWIPWFQKLEQEFNRNYSKIAR